MFLDLSNLLVPNCPAKWECNVPLARWVSFLFGITSEVHGAVLHSSRHLSHLWPSSQMLPNTGSCHWLQLLLVSPMSLHANFSSSRSRAHRLGGHGEDVGRCDSCCLDVLRVNHMKAVMCDSSIFHGDVPLALSLVDVLASHPPSWCPPRAMVFLVGVPGFALASVRFKTKH